MSNRSISMGAREWAMLTTLSVLWGGSFFFGEVALRDFGSFSVAFGRVCIAALALSVVHAASRYAFPRDAGLWRDLFIMGALNNALPFSLILWGQIQITGALASILNATTPLFTVLLASLLTADEKLTAQRLLGVLAGIAGVALMLGADLLGELGGEALAQLAVLGAALAYACAAIFGKRFRETPALSIATGQTVASSILLFPLMLAMGGPWSPADIAPGSLLALVALGLLSTAAAYLLYFRILATAGATNLMLVTFLIPVSAILLGAVILGERLTSEQVAGMSLIALGLLAIDGRAGALLLRWRRARVLGDR